MFGLVDVGGTKLLAAVAGDQRRPGPAVRRPTPDAEPLAALIAMLDEARRGAELDAIALAVPGPFDRDAGTIIDPRNIAPAWHHLPVAEQLIQHYGCRVVVENDANCAGLAEAVAGAGKGFPRVVYFTVSTGVGTGVIVDRRAVTGRHDTEGGHQVLWPQWLGGPPCRCGGYGCLETLVSGPAIERRFGVAPELLDDAAAWADVGRWLGLATVNVVAMYDPNVVVFGGGVISSWDRFWPSLSTTVEQHLHLLERPVITRGTLGEERNLWGALALLTEGVGG